MELWKLLHRAKGTEQRGETPCPMRHALNAFTSHIRGTNSDLIKTFFVTTQVQNSMVHGSRLTIS